MPDTITSEISILEVSLLSYPIIIEMDRGFFESMIYASKVGDTHLTAVSIGNYTYIDVSKVFLLSQPIIIMPLS